MVKPVLYRESFTKDYRASLCSQAGCFMLVLIAAVLVVPFIVAFASYSFWLKENSFLAQPSILYQKDLVVQIEGVDAASGAPFSFVYSTNPDYNLLLRDQVRVPVIKTSEFDSNRDSKPDYLDFSISFPVTASQNVLHARVAFLVNYEVNSMTRLTMSSLLYISEYTPIPASSLRVTGDATFAQRRQLRAATVESSYKNSVFNFTTARSGGDREALSWDNILTEYFDRDYRTEVTTHVNWKSSRGLNAPFTFSGRIYYPKHRIYYQPSIAETLKHGWIQYSSFLLITVTIGYFVWGYVFRNRIVDSVVTVDKGLSMMYSMGGSKKEVAGLVPAWKGQVY